MADAELRDGDRVTLRLRVLRRGVPAAVRLRQALKQLLLAYGMRCEAVEWSPHGVDTGLQKPEPQA